MRSIRVLRGFEALLLILALVLGELAAETLRFVTKCGSSSSGRYLSRLFTGNVAECNTTAIRGTNPVT